MTVDPLLKKYYDECFNRENTFPVTFEQLQLPQLDVLQCSYHFANWKFHYHLSQLMKKFVERIYSIFRKS